MTPTDYRKTQFDLEHWSVLQSHNIRTFDKSCFTNFQKEYFNRFSARVFFNTNLHVQAKFIVERAIQEKRTIVIRAEGEAKSAMLIGAVRFTSVTKIKPETQYITTVHIIYVLL